MTQVTLEFPPDLELAVQTTPEELGAQIFQALSGIDHPIVMEIIHGAQHSKQRAAQPPKCTNLAQFRGLGKCRVQTTPWRKSIFDNLNPAKRMIIIR